MPGWNDILYLVSNNENGRPIIDFNKLVKLQRDYYKKLHCITNRNIISYYSSWLYKGPTNPDVGINDKDKNAFMSAVHNLDKSKGLDIILHTPGGDIAATESIIDYIHNIFDGNIRAIIPQMAMSA
jgi:ClpP class serine protease